MNMAIRYEPSILYKDYDITPVIEIGTDGLEGPVRYIITDFRGNEIGDPLETLGGACRVIDSLQEMLANDSMQRLDDCFVPEKKKQNG
jgi:hypothetical protein